MKYKQADFEHEDEQDGFIKTLFEEDGGKLIDGLVYGEGADNL